MVEDINEKKSIYFVILIIILIILGIVLTIHFNNKNFVDLKEYDVQTTKKIEEDIATTTLTSKTLKITEKVKYLKKTSMEDAYTTYSESDINTNIVVSFTNNKKLDLNVKKYDIDDALKTKNIVSLYDINLYDGDEYINVHDNNIIIKIPFNSNDYDYDYYKIAYLNDNNEVLEYIDPTMNDGYIIFNTTHLSKYAIVGFKKEIDLTKTTIDLYENNSPVSDYNNVLKLSKSDLLSVIVNTEYKDYKIEYSLRKSDSSSIYQTFTTDLLSMVNDTKEYTLIIKIIVGGKEKVFETIKFRVFDIIVTNEVIETSKETVMKNSKSSVIIGGIPENDSSIDPMTTEDTKYNYDDKEKNKDILIDTASQVQFDSTITDENKDQQETQTTEEVKIEVKGNIYVLDETDLSNLELTGILNIETGENITYSDDTINNLNSIEINTDALTDKIFTINDIKYTYELNSDNTIIIKKINVTGENTSVESLFGTGYILDEYAKNKIIFNKTN